MPSGQVRRILLEQIVDACRYGESNEQIGRVVVTVLRLHSPAEFKGLAQKTVHNCDAKPALVDKTDCIDDRLLLILRNLLKTTSC